MKRLNYLFILAVFSFISFSCSARQAKKNTDAANEMADTLKQEVVDSVVAEEPVVEEVAEVAPVKETPKPKPEPKPQEKPKQAAQPVETPKTETVQEVAPQPSAPAPVVVTFAEGTVLPIKLSSTLSTDAIQTGARFSGTVQLDVISDSGEVLPEGAKVQGKVISAKNGGRLAGQSELVLELTHIKLGDKYHPLVTQQLVLAGEKSGKKTLRNAGVGAAVGAAIDGGSGAGKGAAIMGGLQLLTNKGALKVPAGFALNFTLAQDLSYEK